jgi:hypothetical protein
VTRDAFKTLIAGNGEPDGDYSIRGEMWHEGALVADLTEREDGVTIRLYPKSDQPWWECDLAALLHTLTQLRDRLVLRPKDDP